MSYPTYAKTKPSGVEWLGDVPTHWAVKRLKHCVIDFVAGGTPDSVNNDFWADEEGVAWVAIADMTKGYVIQSTTKRLTQAGLDDKKLTILPAGTILYSMYASLGKVALLAIPAATNQAILGIIPFRGVAEQRLLRWWLENMEKHISQLSSSNTQDNLNAEKVRNLPVFLPPLPEQQKIAAFLDRKTAQLDAVLAQKERQLELLAEKRQALISQAVTRGLDPTAPLKPSGIPWLGDVPEHWEVMPIKYLSVKIGSGKTPRSGAESYVSSGVIFLRSQNVYDNGLRLDDVAFISDEVDEEMSNSRVQSGDLLLNITGASIGRTCIMPADIPGANVNQHVCIIRLKPGLAAKFVAYYLKSNLVKHQISSFENGSSREGLNFEQVGSLLITLPKISISEQQEIVIYLDRETARMDGIAQAIQVQREKVREYRQALISAAVTGKIDVREL